MDRTANNRKTAPVTIAIDAEAFGAALGASASPTPAQADRLCELLTRTIELLEGSNRLLLSQKEAAFRIGMSVGWLRSNTAPKGDCIPVVQCGGRPMYRPASIDEWAARRELTRRMAESN